MIAPAPEEGPIDAPSTPSPSPASPITTDPSAGAGAGAADPAGPCGPREASSRELLLAFLGAFLLALPFLGKAVHQDDWAYLRLAPEWFGTAGFGSDGAVLEKTTLYQGQDVTAGHGMLHGPVWMALLGGSLKLGGGSIVLPQLVMALLLGLMAVAATSLAARLGAVPLAAGWALALSPVPLVMAGSVMTDLPMAALFTAAMALAVRGLERGSARALIGAGLCGGGAALTRYYGLAILPLFTVLPFLWNARVRWRDFLPLVTAFLLFAAFLAWSIGVTGALDTSRGADVLQKIQIDYRATFLSATCALGGTAVAFALGALFDFGGLRRALLTHPRRLLGTGFGLAAGAALAGWAVQQPLVPEGINAPLQVAAFLAAGLALAAALAPWLGLFLPGQWRGQGSRLALVSLWVLGFTFAATVAVPFGATRYSLPAIPPLVLLAAGLAGRHLSRRASWVACVLLVGLGLGAASADHRASAVYPRFAEQVAERSQEPPWNEGTNWIWGELGFRWYLERALPDARIIARDSNEPAAGDRLIRSSVCTAAVDEGRRGTYRLHPALVVRLKNAFVQAFEDGFPMRVHNQGARAGFYHADAGFLPYAFSRAAHDQLQVFLVQAENHFLSTVQQRARRESYTEAGRVALETFQVHPEIEMAQAVAVLHPGRVSWEGVRVREGTRLRVQVGEHARVWQEGAGGHDTLARVLVEGEVVAELALDGRSRPEDRRWHTLEVDLAAWAGREVELGFEAVPAEGAAEPVLVYVGFADPRLVQP